MEKVEALDYRMFNNRATIPLDVRQRVPSDKDEKRMEEDSNLQKPLVIPKHYTKTSNFGSYEVQYNIYADQARWTPEERLQMLIMLVEGKALDYFVAQKA